MLASIIKINGYRPFKALMLREYWENRRAIFTTPLVIMGLSMVLIIISMGLLGRAIHIDGQSYTLNEMITNMSAHKAQNISAHINHLLLASTLPIMIGAWFCMVFTALGSLYDERKDNSILFWKSMPVSDLQTVLAKLLNVMLVIPFVAIGFTFIFQIFLLIVGSFSTLGTDYSAWDLLWSSSNLPLLVFSEVTYMVMYSLWALPVFAWFMLVSVIAKRSPLLLATIPVALVILFETLFFHSEYLARFIGMRLTGAHILQTDNGFGQNFAILGINTPLENIQSAAKPEFWIGLGIAAALLYATILLRKRNSL
ncbi:MAG: hypothetical protein COA93_00355 [Alphaproteobacteria bacterium]|nr:MAG: hypothetical protein COA93_00355 [Alphaproteobacteria bacterium]